MEDLTNFCDIKLRKRIIAMHLSPKRRIYLNTDKIPTKNALESAKTSNKKYASSCTHNINNKYKNKYNNYKENVPYWMEHPEVCKSSLASPEEIEEMEKLLSEFKED